MTVTVRDVADELDYAAEHWYVTTDDQRAYLHEWAAAVRSMQRRLGDRIEYAGHCLDCGTVHLTYGEALQCDHRHGRHRERMLVGCPLCDAEVQEQERQDEVAELMTQDPTGVDCAERWEGPGE